MLKYFKSTNLGVSMIFIILSLSYFSVALQNIMVFVFVLYAIFNQKNFPQNVNYKLYVLFISPFLLDCFTLIYDNSLDNVVNIFTDHSILLILGILILKVRIKEKNLIIGFTLFLASSVLASLISITKGLILFNHNGVFFHPNFAPHFTIIHHPYYAAYLFVALVFFIEQIKKFSFQTGVKFLIVVILVLGILISTARLGQLFLILYLAYKGFYVLYERYNKWAIVIILVVISGTLLYLLKSDAFTYKYKQEFLYKNSPRLMIWTAAVNIIKENDFVGMGKDGAQQNLNIEYSRLSKEKVGSENLDNYNVHNQYLDYILKTGWVGVIYIFSILFLLAFAIRSRLFYFIFFMVYLCSFLFVENVLNRQVGVYFIGCFIPLFINISLSRNQNLE
jgi:O-antigen ligase